MICIENTTIRTAKSADYLGNAGSRVIGGELSTAPAGLVPKMALSGPILSEADDCGSFGVQL
jgi:hypothetical protein